MANLSGMTLGPYRIIERVGRGGMATVYKAYHAAMDRHVAIKILPEDFADDPNFRKRFEREAKTVAKLQHPHILPVFDYGEDQGINYLVMPFIPSGTLKDYMKQGRLDFDEISRILTRLCEALDYAHNVGVLHRDIKPDNVLFDEHGNAMLTDFGLTRMMEGNASLTGSGVLGTPAYMSPEQGQGEKLDNRSDIYSMGVILYEMVTGEVPFSADTPVAVILKHIRDPLPMPNSMRADLPDAAETVILKALAKDPYHRWATAVEMATAFRLAISGMPVDVEPPPESMVDIRSTVEGIQPAIPDDALMPDTDTQSLRRPKQGGGRVMLWIVVIAIIFVLFGLLILWGDGDSRFSLTAAEATRTDRPTDTATDEPTPMPTDTAIPTETGTLDPIEVARATRNADLTITAAMELIIAEELTATATLWTDTPTPTVTQTETPTEISTVTPSLVPSPTEPTPTLGAESIELALQGVDNNEEWTPVVQEFDGVEMVLVPAGCFMMGSENDEEDERPVHEQCFNAPFWIDRYEVTNEQFGQFGGSASDVSSVALPEYPRDNVNWLEASSFCEARSARLPTEAEWEFAARGPDNLTYPWGNEFDSTVVNFCDSNCDEDIRDETADDGYRLSSPVGTYPGGVSWVGAYDMSGNVWEWTSSLYASYPYVSSDGRESPTDRTNSRVFRGGEFRSVGSGTSSFKYDVSTTFRDYADITYHERTGIRCARDFDGEVVEIPTPEPSGLVLLQEDFENPDAIAFPVEESMRVQMDETGNYVYEIDARSNSDISFHYNTDSFADYSIAYRFRIMEGATTLTGLLLLQRSG